jgi:hypothetical protein
LAGSVLNDKNRFEFIAKCMSQNGNISDLLMHMFNMYGVKDRTSSGVSSASCSHQLSRSSFKSWPLSKKSNYTVYKKFLALVFCFVDGCAPQTVMILLYITFTILNLQDLSKNEILYFSSF